MLGFVFALFSKVLLWHSPLHFQTLDKSENREKKTKLRLVGSELQNAKEN